MWQHAAAEAVGSWHGLCSYEIGLVDDKDRTMTLALNLAAAALLTALVILAVRRGGDDGSREDR